MHSVAGFFTLDNLIGSEVITATNIGALQSSKQALSINRELRPEPRNQARLLLGPRGWQLHQNQALSQTLPSEPHHT